LLKGLKLYKKAERKKAAGGGGWPGNGYEPIPICPVYKEEETGQSRNTGDQNAPLHPLQTPFDKENLICNSCLSKPNCLYNDTEADYCVECFWKKFGNDEYYKCELLRYCNLGENI
jgi:hypothetical protein